MKFRRSQIFHQWALAIWVSGFFLLSAEVGSWAYVKLIQPPNLHLYPVREAWLHGFEAGREDEFFYLPRGDHQQSFCRAEFCTRVNTNSAGFRAELALDLPLDIALVGDSFAFGWGVEVEARTADQLSQNLPGLKVATLAYPNGHSPPFYELFLRQHPEYWPRLLIVQLFAWNDLNHDQLDVIYFTNKLGQWTGLGSKTLNVVPEGFIDGINSPQIPRYRGVRGIAANSWFGRLIFASAKSSKAPLQINSPASSPAKPAALSPLDQGWLDDTANSALAHVKNLAERARGEQTRIAVLYVPFANLAGNYPALCQYEMALCAARATRADPLAKSLKTWTTAHQIPFIDPLTVLRRAENHRQKTYFSHDGHWTAAGHRIVAELLRDWICREAAVTPAFTVACSRGKTSR